MMDEGALCAREAACHLLLMQKPARLPVRVERLSLGKNLIVDSFERYCTLTGDTLERLLAGSGAALRDGCTLIRQRGENKVYIILYNEGVRSLRRRNFTLAHEMGHIFLGHEDDSPAFERQADAFAAELLAPRILVAEYLKSLRADQNPVSALAQAFNISRSMAGLRVSGLSPAKFTEQERALLFRYEAALPSLSEPEIAY